MKRTKRFFSFILSFIIVISFAAVPSFAVNSVTDGYITYIYANLKDTSGHFGSYLKAASCMPTASGSIVIKSEINGTPVVSLGTELFKSIGGITDVTVPETVAQIEAFAFENCFSLKTVAVNSENCIIGKGCFRNCSALETVDLPAKLASISQEAFSGCSSLSEINIPETVEVIGSNAFTLCSALTEVNIPSNLLSIGKNAFSNCSGIEKFTVAAGNENYKSIENCLYSSDGKTLIQYPNNCGKTVFSVPDSTETIDDFAMGANTVFYKIILPQSLKTISDYAFCDCSELSDIVIPQSVEYVGSMAFARCGKLKSITVPKSVETYEGAFYQSGLESVTLESGITKIDTKTFEKCARLREINIPSSVKSIGNGAFDGCSSLETVDIPSSVTSIGVNAFINCGNLKLNVKSGSAAEKYAKDNSIPYNVSGEKTLVSLGIASLPDKTDYYYKTGLDTSGLKLKAVYSDGSSETVSSGFTASPTFFDSIGSKNITVTYGGETCSFKVNVSYAWWQILIRILLLGFLWY